MSEETRYGASCREAPGDMIGPCWTWVLVQLVLHSAEAVAALHGEETTHMWSVVHRTGAGEEHMPSLVLIHAASPLEGIFPFQ